MKAGKMAQTQSVRIELMEIKYETLMMMDLSAQVLSEEFQVAEIGLQYVRTVMSVTRQETAAKNMTA